MRTRSAAAVVVACAALVALAALGFAQPRTRHNRIIELLAQDKVVIGWFASARTEDAARRAVRDGRMDFVFFNMEAEESYSPEDLARFLQAMSSAGLKKNPNSHPVMARLPIFHDDPAAARRRTAEVLNLGAHAIVFPGMDSRDEAEAAIASMRFVPRGTRPEETGGAPAYWGLSQADYRRRADVYPINPEGELASVFIIESEKGIANTRDITRVRPTVAIPGPGTLRRVYGGDMAKVEQAIQTQLSACKEFRVPCGITAGASDVAARIEQGFRVIIIYDRDYPETIGLARQAARR